MLSQEMHPYVPEENKEMEFKSTDLSFREKVDKAIGLYCKNFEVEGKENLIKVQESEKDAKFIIASSHISNLDAPSAVKALGDRLDIQITVESLLRGMTRQEPMFRLAGKDHFTSLEYSKSKNGKSGVFNPKDFELLSEQIKNGKTPWMAIHPFTVEEEMQDSRVGSVYLAHKTRAKIIPTALEVKGVSITLDSPVDLVKGLIKKADAKYHVGEIMELPKIDINIIEKVFEKRANNEKISDEDRQQFSAVHKELKDQADYVAQTIANMLPESQRGAYKNKDKEEIK